MAINTNPFNSLAGTVWFEIDAGAGIDANVEILDLGSIEYEFDLIPSDRDIDGVAGMPGAMKVTFDDSLSNRGSLYESLVSKLGGYVGAFSLDVPKAKVIGYLQEPDQTNLYRFPFEFTVADLSLDERSKKTTIGFSPRTVNITVGDWVTDALATNNPSRMSFRSGEQFFVNSWASGDFIQNVVERLDNSAGTNSIFISGDLVASAGITNSVYVFERMTDIINSPTNIEVSDYSTLMFVQDEPMAPAVSNSVFSKVQTFAGMEGAIFGCAFNMNYYINRLTNIINVDVTNTDIIDLKFEMQPRDVKGIIVSYTNTNQISTNTNIGFDLPKITNSSGGIGGWLAGSRDMAIDLKGWFPQLNRGVYNVSDNFVDGDDDSLAPFNDAKMGRFAAGVYAHSTGALVTNRALYSIDLELMGATKIKPYEVIKFDNTVPLRYQGKHFRPTSVSYDLKADRVRVSAYEIDTFEVTPPEPPDTNVTINVGDCESGEMALMLSYGIENTFNVTSDETGENTSNFLAFNTFTNVFADEFGNMVTLQEGAFNVTAFSTGDGNISNVTGISL